MATRPSPALRAILIALLMTTAACRDGGGGGSGSAKNVAESDTALDEARLSKVSLRITTAAGKEHKFTAELAVGPEVQQRGLMERTSLANDAGMVFPFTYPVMASFWMKNTKIPLDLLFIRANGTIASILQGKPEDLHPLAANEPVAAVLEINSGRAEALGITTGDRVTWGDCKDETTPVGVWRADQFCPKSAQ